MVRVRGRSRRFEALGCQDHGAHLSEAGETCEAIEEVRSRDRDTIKEKACRRQTVVIHKDAQDRKIASMRPLVLASLLRKRVGNLDDQRTTIINALDFVLQGCCTGHRSARRRRLVFERLPCLT